MTSIISTYSVLWVIPALVLSALLALFLYKKNDWIDTLNRTLKYTLISLRTLSVFIILLLLIGIVVDSLQKKIEQPLVFLLQDNTESVLQNRDSTYYKNQFITDLKSLKTNLSADFEVIDYAFDTDLKSGIQSSFNGKNTDIAHALDEIYSRYNKRNIGAIVMATDGIYNQGLNPIYTIENQIHIPIYSIGLGDTTPSNDVILEEIKHNDIAFLGNDFPLDVRISQKGFKGQKAIVNVMLGDQSVGKQAYTFTEENEEITLHFNITATSVGLKTYTVKITPFTDEFTDKNNSQNAYITVIDGRQKIALLSSGPHPDLGSISYVVNNNKNYQIDVLNYNEVKSVEPYDLIICHNYTHSNSSLDEQLKMNQKPSLFIIGSHADVNSINNLKLGVSIRNSHVEDVQWASNGAFSSILYPAEVLNTLSQAPPLSSPMGQNQFAGGLDVLAYQKLGNIQLDQPLIYFSEKNNKRYGVIMGEGIWRWRLYDQKQHQNTKQFELFISKIISFLALKENKSPFKVHFDNEYNEGQSVKATAEFYNESYDLVNESEVTLILTDENEKTYNYSFFKTSDAYQLDLGQLPKGVYQWEASMQWKGKNYTQTGLFLVKELKQEWLIHQANHQLLKSLSKNTSGHYYTTKEMQNIAKDLKSRNDIVSVSYSEITYQDLIDYKWIFFILLIALSAEWFLRKYNGGY